MFKYIVFGNAVV